LLDLGSALMESGHFSYAEKVMRDIPDSQKRATGLANLTSCMATFILNRPERDHAKKLFETVCRITAELLRDEYWPELVFTLVKLFPEAFDLLVDEVENCLSPSTEQ
ncbi:hypothetical protein, partial [Streptosporangium sp. NPDC002524]|uniref:hypothetical protein n=1 Tax=Streptosporangium sp. NPDC002524 TaxID=3154537 RepID=UPI00332B4CA7